MMAPSHGSTILLTGGTGKVGACISNLLATASVPNLLASRSPETNLRHPPYSGAVQFDWLDRATWETPFTTAAATTTFVSAVFLLAPPVPDCSPIMNDFVDHARAKHGVRRFVLLGATAVEPGGPLMGGTARYLAELGGRGEVEWAVLRPSWFQGMSVHGTPHI